MQTLIVIESTIDTDKILDKVTLLNRPYVTMIAQLTPLLKLKNIVLKNMKAAS